MKRTILTLIVLLLAAPASAAFLGGNSRLGENFPGYQHRAGIEQPKPKPATGFWQVLPGTGGRVSCCAKPIEQFKVGDLVLSSPEDDPDGPVVAKRVEEVFERGSVLFDLHVGGKLIRTTAEHPFYVQGKGWTAAKSLVAGDLLRSHDGQWVAVESTCGTGEVAPVYNLRVEEYHTYFVGSAEWGFSVWAHNACRAVDLEPGVGKQPVGPDLNRGDAINAGLDGNDLIAGSQGEAGDIARAIGGGQEPIPHFDDPFGPHFHPAGKQPDIHIWW